MNFSAGVSVDVAVTSMSREEVLEHGAPCPPICRGYSDAFVAKLGNDGALLWNTFSGGWKGFVS